MVHVIIVKNKKDESRQGKSAFFIAKKYNSHIFHNYNKEIPQFEIILFLERIKKEENKKMGTEVEMLKKKNTVGLCMKILSIIMFLTGIILSIALGILFKQSVSEMFMTQSYFNWGAMFIGLWADFVVCGILFALGEVISLLTKSKNMQEYYEDLNQNAKIELPNI